MLTINTIHLTFYYYYYFKIEIVSTKNYSRESQNEIKRTYNFVFGLFFVTLLSFSFYKLRILKYDNYYT